MAGHWVTRELRRLAGLVAALAVWAGGCSDKASAPVEAPGATRTAREGPVSVRVAVRPDRLHFQQSAELVIEVTADAGTSFTLDDYAEALREQGKSFELRAVSEGVERTPGEGGSARSEIHRYRLEFFLPGEYELPSPVVRFASQEVTSGEDGSGALGDVATRETRTLSTEPVTVVASDPTGRTLSREELASIPVLDPIELPTVWSRWWWLAPTLGVVLIVLLLVLFPRLRRFLRRRLGGRLRPALPPIPADEWARQRLAALVAEGLLERGEHQAFYYRVSFIVRGYVERRYGLSAAEMTTEEFLAAAVADARFGPQITEHLRQFQSACDEVKYARHEPSGAESDGVLSAAGTFVERTSESHGGTEGGNQRHRSGGPYG